MPGEQGEHDGELLAVGGRRVGHPAGLLELDPLVDEHRGVAAVVDDQRRPAAVAEVEGARGELPVLRERLALEGEDRHALRIVGRPLGADHHRGGGVVLRREDVARHPAHLGAERLQRLDQHRRLDRHVQRPHDALPLERLAHGVLLLHRHQPRHLLLGEPDLLAPPLGEREVLDEVVELLFGGDRGAHLILTFFG
jgi:hypothetical protein